MSESVQPHGPILELAERIAPKCKGPEDLMRGTPAKPLRAAFFDYRIPSQSIRWWIAP
jgi:hypothetical protein